MPAPVKCNDCKEEIKYSCYCQECDTIFCSLCYLCHKSIHDLEEEGKKLSCSTGNIPNRVD